MSDKMTEPTPVHTLLVCTIAELRRIGILSDSELCNICRSFMDLADATPNQVAEHSALLMSVLSMVRDPVVAGPLRRVMRDLVGEGAMKAYFTGERNGG